MSWLVWNMRGIHQRDAVAHLQEMIRQHNISFLAILEPKAAHHELPRFAFRIGFQSWAHGCDDNSHIWILWKCGIQVEMLFISAQSITVKLQNHLSSYIYVSCIYANCLKRILRLLWEHLEYIASATQHDHIPWMIAGDFNVISSTVEKQGGGQIDLGAVHDFQNFTARHGFIDAGYHGENFTWCNNRRGRARIWERLDRVFMNIQLHTKYSSLVVHHIPRIISDHSPILIKLEGDIPKVSSGSIFQRM